MSEIWSRWLGASGDLSFFTLGNCASVVVTSWIAARKAGSAGVDVLDWVLTGGEDHALAACFPPDAELPPGWHVVGRVTDRGAAEAPLITVSGRHWAAAPGWDHFHR